MSSVWQNLIVFAVALAAAGFLLRKGWLVFSGKGGGCGSCAKCPAGESAELVQIDLGGESEG